jgi:hypothetical protein
VEWVSLAGIIIVISNDDGQVAGFRNDTGMVGAERMHHIP